MNFQNLIISIFSYMYIGEFGLRNWFDEISKNMEVVELKRSIKQLSDSPHFIDSTKEIPTAIKTGLDTSWITSLFIKPKRVVMKSLNMEDPEKNEAC